MSDYMPEEVILKILNRLPVKSLVRFRSVCKSWNTLIFHPCFISAHLQSSLSNNTPFLLLGGLKNGRDYHSLHYDNDGFGKFKQLQLPDFGYTADSPMVGSCNGLICVQLYPFDDYGNLNFLLWNPSIQKHISLPQFGVTESVHLKFGFGFDSRTNDYKLLIVGVDDDGNWIQPYLFSFNENCWRKVTAAFPNYAAIFDEMPMPFVNGALNWLAQKDDDEDSNVILGFDLSAEEFFDINLPESLIRLRYFDLSIMKYGESSIAVSTHAPDAELHELWVMKEYAVVESWTKLLTLHRIDRHALVPRVLGFRKNGEVLLRVDKGKMASLDSNCQQMEASLDLNCQLMELHGVEVGAVLLSVDNYVESLVLLDKAVDHPRDSSDSE
ncbi:hypothetical protein HRI_001613500 [Hibiscus trionum]|uniref:F-box domain-containing protein n=1 Tax=Hibiscus trionum TaxID=183268 RepID=A0A9W7LVP8_HIBTR|nr:hypothetical protein HRI_001613500 [Hibiscus trionum]